MPVTIRFAGPDDADTIFAFVVGLADYERARHAVQVTPAVLRAQLASPRPPFECLLAEEDGAALGFALFFQTYSTWRGRPGLWLEDLYVPQAHRRRGIGGALLRQLAAVAVERDCARLEWAVLDWNAPAIAFYRGLGAEPLDEWTTYRLSDGPLRALAALPRPEGSATTRSSMSLAFRAVIFDLGGVVVGSPLHAIAAYERELGIPAGAVNRVVVASGPEGGWSRLERGELDLEAFYPVFEADCAAGGCVVDARELMRRVGAATVPRAAMLEAIRRIREAGLKAAALTNNWVAEDEGTRVLAPHFDVFVESAVVGLRKPDPRIFTLACERLGVTPGEAVFLDDIGSNLKSARALGMTTIKVDEPDAALAELETVLGLVLRG